MNFRNQASAAALCAVFALTGCGTGDEGPVVNSRQLALTASQNAEQALQGLYDAGAFLADSAALAQTLGTLGGSETCESGGAPVCDPADPNCVPVTDTEVCTEDEVTPEDLQEMRADIQEAIDDVVELMRERIFTPENLESEDETSATYLLGASVLCDDADDSITPTVPPGPAAPGGSGASSASQPLELEEAEEETCEEQAARLQIRLRLSSQADGDVDVELLITPARRNPVTFQLYHDRVGVQIDYGEIYLALQDLGEDLENVAGLDGVTGFEIVKLAELDYAFRMNVIEALHVGVIDDGGGTVNVDLAASSPTMELRLDGNLRRIIGTLDYGALHVTGPLETFRGDDEAVEDAGVDPVTGLPIAPPPPKPPLTGDIDFLLGGVNGSVTYDGTEDAINLNGLGLGDQPTTLSHDGNLLLQVDVNQAQGRRFDLGIQSDGAGATTMTFSPTLDLSVMVAFASLASQLEDIPAYLMGDTLRFWFDGTNPSVRGVEGVEQVEVLSGTLHMSSATHPETNVDVPAGSCLFGSDVEPTMSLLDSLSTGACQ